eukprot:TRINITY_DN2533_c0_g1_i4.p1 TRINITY_DN2533_c0_g1~~TRINITY_DN2533_c0_g1_i4.p1  ORF type:complete len:348 (-),score=86.37 TRINITY_DN2533_c0_g1_i4:41-1084(-)
MNLWGDIREKHRLFPDYVKSLIHFFRHQTIQNSICIIFYIFVIECTFLNQLMKENYIKNGRSKRKGTKKGTKMSEERTNMFTHAYHYFRTPEEILSYHKGAIGDENIDKMLLNYQKKEPKCQVYYLKALNVSLPQPNPQPQHPYNLLSQKSIRFDFCADSETSTQGKPFISTDEFIPKNGNNINQIYQGNSESISNNTNNTNEYANVPPIDSIPHQFNFGYLNPFNQEPNSNKRKYESTISFSEKEDSKSFDYSKSDYQFFDNPPESDSQFVDSFLYPPESDNQFFEDLLLPPPKSDYQFYDIPPPESDPFLQPPESDSQFVDPLPDNQFSGKRDTEPNEFDNFFLF